MPKEHYKPSLKIREKYRRENTKHEDLRTKILDNRYYSRKESKEIIQEQLDDLT